MRAFKHILDFLREETSAVVNELKHRWRIQPFRDLRVVFLSFLYTLQSSYAQCGAMGIRIHSLRYNSLYKQRNRAMHALCALRCLFCFGFSFFVAIRFCRLQYAQHSSSNLSPFVCIVLFLFLLGFFIRFICLFPSFFSVCQCRGVNCFVRRVRNAIATHTRQFFNSFQLEWNSFISIYRFSAANIET